MTEPLQIDRPRERVWRRGVHAVGDEELLATLLGTGVRDHPARAIAEALVATVGGVAALSRASPYELAQIAGIGAARAARVAAAFELGRRALGAQARREIIVSPKDVARHLLPRIAGMQQEIFFAIGLDVRNGLLDIVEVGRGSVYHVDVHPREVFRPLVRMAASGAVIAHNHPTGDAQPSAEDLALTRRLREVGLIVGIPIVDHIVVAGADFCSIAEYAGAAL